MQGCAGYHSSPSAGLGGAGKSVSRGALRQYVDSFGQETVQEMARIVSQEAATLIEMQTGALFGNYRALQEQMEVCLCFGNSAVIAGLKTASDTTATYRGLWVATSSLWRTSWRG